MAGPSKIDRLPPAVRESLDEWFRDRALTQQQIAECVNELLAKCDPTLLGEYELSEISRHDIGREQRKIREMGDRLQKSRHMANALAERIGADTSGKQGRIVLESINALSLEIMGKVSENSVTQDSAPTLIAMLKDMSLTLSRTQKAGMDNIKREAEIKRQLAEEMLEKTRNMPSTATKGEITSMIKREIYGIKDEVSDGASA
uniref:Uncharacterized protein n=1 Tax=Candidatus Kentrum sp. UNK TaxID=2126344 RepID=A0A450ZWV3_9GAMM|nr:MAG: Protein of unknown function (DUF3486) [Candidatus Kentron sp. UNK]VFK68321.1 MAG: Protein of unknown function (DUF3486) [Candidatus Kentron sp. UNK]